MTVPTFADKDYIGINGVGINQLTHPHFEEWFKYIITEYEPPIPPKICLFLPCSAIKPYYNSPIHGVINKAICKYENHIHKIVISNAGIIPYEFSDQYPFNSYDWNPLYETEEIKNRYIQITAERLIAFFTIHSIKYKIFLSYLMQNSEEFIALEVASQISGVDIVHINVTNHILPDNTDNDLVLIFEDNLNNLDKKLKELTSTEIG